MPCLVKVIRAIGKNVTCKNMAWTIDERTDATCVNGHIIPTILYDKFDLEPI